MSFTLFCTAAVHEYSNPFAETCPLLLASHTPSIMQKKHILGFSDCVTPEYIIYWLPSDPQPVARNGHIIFVMQDTLLSFDAFPVFMSCVWLIDLDFVFQIVIPLR